MRGFEWPPAGQRATASAAPPQPPLPSFQPCQRRRMGPARGKAVVVSGEGTTEGGVTTVRAAQGAVGGPEAKGGTGAGGDDSERVNGRRGNGNGVQHFFLPSPPLPYGDCGSNGVTSARCGGLEFSRQWRGACVPTPTLSTAARTCGRRRATGPACPARLCVGTTAACSGDGAATETLATTRLVGWVDGRGGPRAWPCVTGGWTAEETVRTARERGVLCTVKATATRHICTSAAMAVIVASLRILPELTP